MLKPHDKHEGAVVKRAARKQEEESHGGAWKVAFADFCLALLSLFLVLWLMATREQQAMKEIMIESAGRSSGRGLMPESIGGPRGSLIERFALPHNGTNDKAVPNARANAATPPPKVRYETPKDLGALAKALSVMSDDAGLSANLASVVTPYGLRVMLHDTDERGMFVRGSPVPTDRFRRLLRKMGPLFALMENQMLIVGHTDSLQYANSDTAAYSNWTLSSSRAMAARAHLLAGGMNTDSILQVVGMADRAPLDASHADAGVNRRIELLVLTRGQSATIAAMFGVPHNKEMLTDDVDTAVPDLAGIRQLRDQLVATKGSAAAAPVRRAAQ